MKNAKINNQQRNYFAQKYKDILYIKKINIKKKLHPTGTLITIFHKPAGEANLYIQFGYVLQTVFNITMGKLLGPMNSDMININTQVHNQQ